jgi:hypothetical protein
MIGRSTVLKLALMLGMLNLQSTIVITLLVLVAQGILMLNATECRFLLTSGAAGGVAGGLVGPTIIARLGGQEAHY